MTQNPCNHKLVYQSGGFYVACQECGEQWVAKKRGGADTDIDHSRRAISNQVTAVPSEEQHWKDAFFREQQVIRDIVAAAGPRAENHDIFDHLAALRASPAVAPVAVSVKGLLERCTARDGKETAAQIEAEVIARLEPEAFSVAKQTFRAFAASWEGSIAVAIAAYLDARILSSITPATKGGALCPNCHGKGTERGYVGEDGPPVDIKCQVCCAALAQDTDGVAKP